MFIFCFVILDKVKLWVLITIFLPLNYQQFAYETKYCDLNRKTETYQNTKAAVINQKNYIFTEKLHF